MSKRNILGVTLMLTGALLTTAQKPVYLDRSKPIEERVEDALSRMTTQEKVALCHAQSKFTSAGVPRLGIPEIMMSDGPHGVRAEICWDSWDYAGWTSDSITAFPALTALAATWDPTLAAEYGRVLGEEANYRKKNVMLGPGVNIYRTPLNGRNFEYLGEDPYLAGALVVPYIQNLQNCGVAACVKHFALNNQEKWRSTVNVTVSNRALREIYLPAFEKAVKEGNAWAIMGSYNKIWNQYCCHNDRLLNNILKGEWGFDGVVISDWGGAHETREAALYGLDIEMGSYTNGLTSEASSGYDEYYLARPFLKMVESGEIPMQVLDDKARRILRLIFRTSMSDNEHWGALCNDDHYDVARRIGSSAITLLKNDPVEKGDKKGRKLLPLSESDFNKILVVGNNADRNLNLGGGSSELKPKRLVSPLEALRERYGDKIVYTEGYTCGRPYYERFEVIPQEINDSLRAKAVEEARDADIVIFIGGLNKNSYQDCESTDREEYSLPFGQNELIAALLDVNPNLVVVNISGNAVAMDWADQVPAILQSWYLGSMGGYSLVDVLSGDVNPSGKLPFSFPRKLEDNGAHYFGASSYPGIESEDAATVLIPGSILDAGKNPQAEYKEDILVGYRWHDTKKIPARFPFGHGLSYTDFSYSKPVLSAKSLGKDDEITITLAVTNTGDRAGSEAVQLYIADEKASVLRPAKELKKFMKVQLEPGETKNIEFCINEEDLRFFNPETDDWCVEPGFFSALIGSSSKDIRCSSRFQYK